MAAAATRVLLVDDDRDTRRVFRALLEGAGFVVETASNGPAGLRAARARLPDVILLDILMPGMDGGQVLHELRRDERTRSTPVLALTGVPDWLTHHRETATFDAVVLKPVSGDRLVAEIARVLESTRR